MKLFITYLLSAFAFLPSAFAQGQISQVDYAAAPGDRAVRNSGGTGVANGNQVWIGTFNPGFDLFNNGDDPVDLLANWHHFGSTTTRTISQPGQFTGSSFSDNPFFGNKPIYLWIFSTDFAAAPTPDFSNVNEYGLFSSTLPNWTFSPDPPPNNSTEVYSDEVNLAFAGSFNSTHLILAAFTPIPEPTTLGLLCLGLPATILALRKRRSNR